MDSASFFGETATENLLAAPYLAPMAYNGEVKGVVGAWAGFTNGNISSSALCSPSWSSKRGRCDAIRALEQMNAEYRATFGVNMTLNSAYRTYAEQAALHSANPVGAAAPGTSNHGWALAIDFGGGINRYGSAQHNWLRSNANRFGWFQPSWAQYYGSLPEPWHWEYAGSVASNRADQSLALAMELTRTQPWNSAAQQQCLSNLWNLRSGWNFRAVGSGDLRGIPQASMSALFGRYWTSSTEAIKWLQIPQRQIESGLRDITANYGNACAAWTYWGPVVTAEVTGPTTVPADGVTSIVITYVKARQPVPSAGLTLQELQGGTWVDSVALTAINGTVTHELSPGSRTTTYRVRNWNGSAVSPSFTVYVAEVTATVTGPTTVPSGGRTSLAITYTKDDQPVPAATVTLQSLQNNRWVDSAPLTITNGSASHLLEMGTSTTYRVRNWNTSVTSPGITINVAELTAALSGPRTVAAGGSTTISATYSKDGALVPSATVTLQSLRDGEWVDVAPVTITGGTGTAAIRPDRTTQYRLRNWNDTAFSEPFAVVVVVAEFSDVPDSHPSREFIEWLAVNGVTTGFPDGTFRPTQTVTRDAMAAFLYRLAGQPTFSPPDVSPFADVTPDHPFYLEITWLAENGISTGSTLADGTVVFQPTAPVARDAMAAFLHRYAGSPTFVDPTTSPFTDVSPRHPFYTEISWLAAEGISTGTALPDGTRVYEPTAPVTREAMAAFLYRLHGLIG